MTGNKHCEKCRLSEMWNGVCKNSSCSCHSPQEQPKGLESLLAEFEKEFAAYSNHERLDKESFISWAKKFISKTYKAGQLNGVVKGLK